VGEHKRSIFIVHNPVAGWRRRRFLDAVLWGLDEAGCMVGLRATQARGDAEDFAATAPLDAYDVIAVAGGDGTVNEVANGLARREDTRVPSLAVIPMGTANILAHEIGLAVNPRATVDYLMNGTGRTVRLGTVNDRVFVCMASAGFDARVVDQVSVRAKRLLGKGAYGLAALRGLAAWSDRPLEIEADGMHLTASTATAQKAQRYGGTFIMAPAASLSSPSVQLCAITRPGRGALVRCAIDLGLGRIARSAAVTSLAANTVTISGTGPVQADGDVVDRLPVVIRADAVHLKLLYPRNFL